MILREIPGRNARRYPDKTALVFGDRRFTFKEFNNRTNSLVNALYNLGVVKGDRVAVLADGGNQYIETTFAGIKGGFVVAPINPNVGQEGITFLINNAGANTLILGENYKGLIDSLRPELKTVNNFIILGNPQDDMKSYEALISSSPPTEPTIEVKDDDLHYLPCSGGTTGLPKQAMITNKASLVSALDILPQNQLTHKDIFLFTLPPFWGCMVPNVVFPSFYMGCTVILLKDMTPHSILEAIEKERVTTFLFGTFLLLQLLDYPELDRYDHSSLRCVIATGFLPKEGWQRAVKVFGNIFGNGYATAELSGIAFLSPEDVVLEGAKEKRLQSCGREAINTEVRVVNEQGEDVARGEMGELIARGENMMTGYWNAPQATEEAIKGGYLYTGDLATMDEEGYIYLSGRKQDSITSQGKLIASKEIEDIINRHSAVSEVAVIGIPDPKLGEAIQAVIVLKRGGKATEKEIIELCQQYLPSHAVPRSVDFVDSLPRTPIGKVLKRELRSRYGGGWKRT